MIDKTDSKGKILPEMILICQNPNEYIRGVTLRFLCRLNETEIIEPLIPSILANLEHRHPYIRRNAILAVMAIYKLPQGEQLLVDAPEMIEKVLSTEADQSAKRNAFLMLFTCAQDRAVNYLLTHVDRVSEWGELLQMVVLELIRKVCRANKGEKGKYIKIIISLLSVPSAAVIYECAGTLVSLSSAPTAIKAAANTYCQLLLSQSDNNVKFIVLDRLNLKFYMASEEGDANDSSKKSQQVVNSITVSSKRPAILADGTYATQSAASETAFSPPTVVNTTLTDFASLPHRHFTIFNLGKDR
ncbi:putative clathrin/coatomer adaptor, adaptin-like, armadillo-like helical [Helianthus annuus]|nr:putative clathrin/coatomer adaptor, adaptin-like, armadillo-like helical [Helianthus annuus]